MYDRRDRLISLGLVASVPHGVGLGKPERGRQRQRQARRERFFPASKGIEEEAADLGEGPASSGGTFLSTPGLSRHGPEA